MIPSNGNMKYFFTYSSTSRFGLLPYTLRVMVTSILQIQIAGLLRILKTAFYRMMLNVLGGKILRETEFIFVVIISSPERCCGLENGTDREKAFQFQWIFAGYPLVFSFLSNLIVLFVLIWSMVQLERKLQSLNNSWRQAPDGEDANIMGRFSRRVSSLASSISSITPRRSSNTYEVVNITNSSSTYVLPNRSRRSILNQNNYQRGLINQAISYTTAFLAVYSFSFIYRILSQTNSNGAPFFIIFLARTTNPLQGIFNIIIYTRTRVASLRANSEHSWIKAFWIVIISGADHDVINSRNQRNRSRNRMSESGPSHTNTPISNSQRIRGVRFDEQSFPIPIQDQGSVVEKEPKSSQDQGSVVEKESKSSQDESGGLRESEIEMILRACGQATTAQTQEGKSGIRLNESDEVDEFIPPQDNRIIKS